MCEVFVTMHMRNVLMMFLVECPARGRGGLYLLHYLLSYVIEQGMIVLM